jgi:DNA-binding NarL/FixJ family response regulator
MLVVMLTSSNQPSDFNRAYDLGVNSYLVKPSALEQLVTMLGQFSSYWQESNVGPLLQVDEASSGVDSSTQNFK